MYTKAEGKEIVKTLVENFKASRSEYKKASYNETQVRNDFINPLLQALGWDVFNENALSQYLREVIQEDTVDVEIDGIMTKKKPDYAFSLNGKRKVFVEVKKPAVSIETATEPAFQIRRYGWNAKLPVSILTNFDKFIIYDCANIPSNGDDVRIGRMKVYSFDEYIEKFDEIYDYFSLESFRSGHFDELFSSNVEKAGTEPFDDYFLKQIERWRGSLAVNLVDLNPDLQQDELNYLIQKLVNRIVFLRVCEDRELEKYKGLLEVQNYNELKEMFKKADKRYNSGLFDFIEDELSLHIELSDEILIEIFKELYYPQSPYVFSVVESSVLGEIYELFLAKEVKILADKHIVIEEKPEVIESNGVVTTPRFIVDNIIQKTVVPIIQEKSPKEITAVKIADIACGSGVFLLAAYEYLLAYHLDWYINNLPTNYRNEVYKDKQEQWNLTLHEKQKILRNNIYGVDIDPQAVEVTRFSLLLKVLEDESQSAVDSLLSRHAIAALPNIDSNIQCGNSLVDNSYYLFLKQRTVTGEQLIDINAFDWNLAFKDVFLNGGFDAIIGNPPYIRIQNMMKYSPLEIEYYKAEVSPYETATTANFDKYIVFIERSLSLLKEEGSLGFIVPHKFFTIDSGEKLRKLIAEKEYLSSIVHFGVEQVFKGKLTYTCILNLRKASNESFTIEHVSDLKVWKYGHHNSVESYNSSEINHEPWLFLPPHVKEVFDNINLSFPTRIKEIADVFVGIQTSADNIYVIHPTDENEETVCFEDKDGTIQEIEKAILRPFLHDVRFEAFGTPKSNSYLIFPYKEVINKRAVLYTPAELQKLFPNCYKYLNSNKEALLKRKVKPDFTEENWYKFGRSQSLTKFIENPKLVWTVLSTEPRYVYDVEDIVFSGGGNGPYYGLHLKENSPYSIFYIQAILCNPVIEAMIKTGKTSKFQGGYYSHGKQFVDILPFRTIDFADSHERNLHNRISDYVVTLSEIIEQRQQLRIPHKKMVLERRINKLQSDINEMVNSLYGIDEEMLNIIEEIL